MKGFNNFFYITISLVIMIILLMSNSYSVLAGETVLNTALSVNIPDQQTGNPGDFLTYVLSFQNRSNYPLDLQIEYLNEPDWNIISDSIITVPANTKNFYFPLTVMIPQNAPAELVKRIGARFKIYGEAFSLPMVSIPIFVNPVSTINFSAPSSQNGPSGSTVEYHITVNNSGNTIEHFSVKSVSENEWPLEVEPNDFELNPGESREILIKHQIPGYSETNFDQVKLLFSWGAQQKVIFLTTNVADKYAGLADSYYIWQGQLSVTHPNITELDLTDPNLSFSLSGDWKQNSSGQIYLSDILNDTNRRYFTHYKNKEWDIKAGDFSLPWQGLITPKNSLGNLRIAHNVGTRSYGVYTWDLAEDEDAKPFGLEAFLNKNFRISLLNESTETADQSIIEWDYQTNLNSGLRWSNSLAYNVTDSKSYALGFGIDRFRGNWYFSSNFQAFNEISDFLDKKRLQLTLYQPFSNDSMTIYNQFIYETRTLEDPASEQPFKINNYDDYSFETIFNWPFGLNLRLSCQYQLTDNTYSKDNLSLFIEDTFESGRYQNEWWFSHSIDHSSDDTDSDYSKLNWETEYTLSKNEDLVFNPQLVSNSNSSNNESKFGFGFQQRLMHNSLEWKSLLYRYFSSDPRYGLECSLDWRIYQYLLSLQYIGIKDSSNYQTDTFNLSLRKKFSIPVQKPLGTVEGVAFLDRNQNGIYDGDELPLRNTIMVLDGSTTFETDQNGRYALYGLTPGDHQISLNTLYEVIYLPQTPVTKVTVKQYQTVHLNLPFIRSQNITGIIYFDQNINQTQEPNEPNLAGIPINLKSVNLGETSQTYSNHDGQFIFYQLSPDYYQLSIDNNLLPDNMQAPSEISSIIIDSKRLEDAPLIKIGLIPFERPIDIINESAKLSMTLEQELIKAGDSLLITIESDITLRELELQLPNGEKVKLNTAISNSWKYKWQSPVNLIAGQVKVICLGIDLEGKTHQEEVLLIVTK